MRGKRLKNAGDALGHQVLIKAIQSAKLFLPLWLNSDAGPRLYDNEPRVFDALQRRWKGTIDASQYSYSDFGAWQRGLNRCPFLLKLPGMDKPGRDVLEAACGDGMVGAVLHSFGHRVTLMDLDDWRDNRAKHLPFFRQDLSRDMAEGERFDLIFSYNAFEHIDKPDVAFANMVKMLRPGGLLYLDFGPLYCSAWGLHAYTTLHMPFSQFLFSPRFIEETIAREGVSDLGVTSFKLQPLNQWHLYQFEEMFSSSGLRPLYRKDFHADRFLPFALRFRSSFTGRGLTIDDLKTQAIAICLQKPA